MRSIAKEGTRICFMLMGMLFAGHAFGYDIVVTNDDKLGVVYDVVMQQNEKVTIESEQLNLAVDDLVDSRCPAHVTCIWQGDVAAQVAIARQGEPVGTFKISNISGMPVAASPFLMDTYQIALQSVAPSKEEDGQYSMVLRLVKKAGHCDQILTKICTMDFMPVTCTMGQLSASAGNSCQGKQQLEYQACLRNQFYADEASSCAPNGQGFTE